MSTPTISIYYDDDHQREMEADLLQVGASEVVLDKTVFYPRGGNQDSDHGTLSLVAAPGEALPVVEVLKDEQGIIHHHLGAAPGENWVVGAKAHGSLDWERRISLSRLHTAQHMISRWFIDQQSNSTTRVDITAGGCIIEFERPVSLASALDCAGELNALIDAGRPVTRLITDGYIEIIVEDFDRQPCGGTHVSDVAEIERISLTRHKQNRLEIVAGPAAVAVDRLAAGAALELAPLLETDLAGLTGRVERLLAEQKEARAELHALREEVAKSRINAAVAAIKPGVPVGIDLPMSEAKNMPRLLKAAQGPDRVFVCLCAGRNLAIISGAQATPANALADKIKAHWNLSGGGSPAVAMCGPLPEGVSLDEVLAVL